MEFFQTDNFLFLDSFIILHKKYPVYKWVGDWFIGGFHKLSTIWDETVSSGDTTVSPHTSPPEVPQVVQEKFQFWQRVGFWGCGLFCVSSDEAVIDFRDIMRSSSSWNRGKGEVEGVFCVGPTHNTPCCLILKTLSSHLAKLCITDGFWHTNELDQCSLQTCNI